MSVVTSVYASRKGNVIKYEARKHPDPPFFSTFSEKKEVEWIWPLELSAAGLTYRQFGTVVVEPWHRFDEVRYEVDTSGGWA